jgi:hypothetical protein
MNTTVEVRYEAGTIAIGASSFPDTCPLCHLGIDPRFIGGYLHRGFFELELIFQCPRSECKHLFIGYFKCGQYPGDARVSYNLNLLRPLNPQSREFGEIINSVSKDFVKIYNQAEAAEKLGLDEIAGGGYRKALEFLIKDYAKITDPGISEIIKSKTLSKVIKEHIQDPRIKTTSELASWLGNDEVHYYRKWENKDLSDLKTLIELTVRWIESVQLTDEYKKSMSGNK